MKSRFTPWSLVPAVVSFLIIAGACPRNASAAGFETQASQDAVLNEIGVDEKPGSQAPPGLRFTDQEGRQVALGDFLGEKPVLLTLNFYECPMLCPITFRNLIDTIEEMKGLAPGRDFRIVTVSINPEEDLKKTKARADETYAMIKGFQGPGDWWPFLFGDEGSIRALTRAVGYRYVRLGPDNFAHPAVLVVLTPKGRVSRYLYGIKQEPMDLRLALLESAGGKIGASGALNRVLLFCYHYDPVGKKYQIAALRIMSAAGALTLAFLAGLLITLWRQGKRARRA